MSRPRPLVPAIPAAAMRSIPILWPVRPSCRGEGRGRLCGGCRGLSGQRPRPKPGQPKPQQQSARAHALSAERNRRVERGVDAHGDEFLVPMKPAESGTCPAADRQQQPSAARQALPSAANLLY